MKARGPFILTVLGTGLVAGHLARDFVKGGNQYTCLGKEIKVAESSDFETEHVVLVAWGGLGDEKDYFRISQYAEPPTEHVLYVAWDSDPTYGPAFAEDVYHRGCSVTDPSRARVALTRYNCDDLAKMIKD